MLGIGNACYLGKQFMAYGCDVVILDFLWPYSLDQYWTTWPEVRPLVVRLMPPESTCLQRNQSRGQWLTDREVTMLYAQMAQLGRYDLSIDNQNLSPTEAATKISEFMDKA